MVKTLDKPKEKEIAVLVYRDTGSEICSEYEGRTLKGKPVTERLFNVRYKDLGKPKVLIRERTKGLSYGKRKTFKMAVDESSERLIALPWGTNSGRTSSMMIYRLFDREEADQIAETLKELTATRGI